MVTRSKKRARAKQKFSRYDATEYLQSGKDMIAYLDACMKEAGDDAAVITAALGDIARARGMAELAQKTGLTREGLYKALAKGGNPSFGTVLKVMSALGVRLTPMAAA